MDSSDWINLTWEAIKGKKLTPEQLQTLADIYGMSVEEFSKRLYGIT